jgi:hypothetical protein
MADYEPAPFYAPWPLFGKKFSSQLGEIRANQDALAPIVNATGYDLTNVDALRSSAVFSREWGEEDFHNKFRIRWHKGAEDVEFQCNQGTEAVPNWETYFYIDCNDRQVVSHEQFNALKDLYVGGDFYVKGSPFVGGEANTASNKTGDEGLFFQKTLVDLEFKSLSAGTGITLSSTDNAVTINSTATGGGGGFYGVIFKETEANGSSFRDDQLNVDSNFFYLSSDGSGKPILSWLTGSSGEVNTGSSLGGDVDVFKQKSTFDLEFRGLTAGSNITLIENANDIEIASVGGGGFYGVIYRESESGGAVYKTDTLTVDSDFFYLSTGGDGHPILSSAGAGEANTASSSGGTESLVLTKVGVDLPFKGLTAGSNITLTPSGTDITIASSGGGGGGGFYGVIFKETEVDGSIFRDDQLNVDSSFFYLTSDGSGKPILSWLSGSVGEANTASSAGGTESLVLTKDGVDLPFKGLTAGSNITLTPGANDITIASTASGDGGGGGFYGVIFKETEANGSIFRDDQLNVDSTFFYLTSSGGDEKPILSLKAGLPTFFSHAQSSPALEWQVSHPINSIRLIAQAWDDSNRLITPDTIDTSDPNTVYFYFHEATSGWAQLVGSQSL